jgi:Uma2 family endonuclease
MLLSQKLYTVAEFEQFLTLPENADRYFELIDGEIVEKLPTQKHGRTVMTMGGEVYAYFKQNPIGFAEVEVRYRMPGDEHNSRQPDLAIILDTTTPPVVKGAVPRMPDIAVAVQPPSNTLKSMQEKAAYYLANGARLVWLGYTEKQVIEVLTAEDRQILTLDDVLSGGDVLPGFVLPLRTIFGV